MEILNDLWYFPQFLLHQKIIFYTDFGSWISFTAAIEYLFIYLFPVKSVGEGHLTQRNTLEGGLHLGHRKACENLSYDFCGKKGTTHFI